MQKITPHLWFDKNAEEAVNFYTTLFRGGKVLSMARFPDAGKEVHGMEAGTVMTVEFEIEGYKILALNGGPAFIPNPSISFFVSRKSKEEIDGLWEKLSEGGKILMPLEKYPFSSYYGWVEDKYRVSWQVMLAEGEVLPLMPSLLFTGEQGQADEAIDFYLSVFKDAKRGETSHYEDMGISERKDQVAYADFTLEGQKFAAMDGGPDHKFKFNEAISLLITCQDQAEIDYYWDELSAVPESEQCGWLKDKYGVSWQVVPAGMDKIFNSPDKEKAKEMVNAFLKMKKVDMAKLKAVLES